MLRTLPEDLPAAVVVAQHLGTQGSRLVEILGRRVALPVVWAKPGEPVASGVVTVCPPRSRLEGLPDQTCAITPQPTGGGDRPLDALLVSLADSVGESAAGVVLTGMGSDGMRGAEALREAGGLVIAQSEESAEHPSMPGAVARAGAADLVLPLYEIGPVLMDAAFGRELPLPRAELQAIREVFGTNGEIAATARDLDWSLTAIGPVTDWSPVMRSMVRLVMACPDPAVVFWSDELLVLCNDAATRLLGDHERTAFAGPYRDAFPEAWTRAAPIFEQRMHGSPLRVSAVPFRYVREGRMQDAWFDISDTPIWEQDGTVGGHLPPVLRAHGGAAGGTAARDAQRAGPGAARARPPGGAARGPPDPRDHARRRLPAGADRAPAELVGAIGIDSGGAMAPALGRRPRGIGSGTAFTVWMPPTRSPAGWRTRTPTRSSPSSRSGRTTAAARRREPRPGLRDLRVARRGERRAPRGDPVQRGRRRRDCAPN